MTIKETYHKIKKGLDSGVYKTLRLIQVLPEGVKVLFPYNKLSDHEKAYQRLEHFKQVIDKDLPPGKYMIQVRSHFVNSMTTDFPIEIFEKKPIAISENNASENRPEEIHNHEPLEDSTFMDEETYIKMLKEISELKTQVHMLELERDWFKKVASMEGKQALADQPTGWTALADVMKEVLPPMVNMAQDFFQQKRQLADMAKQSQEGKVKIKRNPSVQINTDEAIAYFDNLFNTDEERAEREFDELQVNNPELYEIVYNALGFTEEEEEEEQEPTGTDY